jgi:outer membrane protein TolC
VEAAKRKPRSKGKLLRESYYTYLKVEAERLTIHQVVEAAKENLEAGKTTARVVPEAERLIIHQAVEVAKENLEAGKTTARAVLEAERLIIR